MDEHVEVNATVTDRWGGIEVVYAGSVPEWAWSDSAHVAAWKKAKRAVILEDRTHDPRGWRVVFAAQAA